MRNLLPATAILLMASVSGCTAIGPSCAEWGLTPGTAEFARCQAAKDSREAAGTRGAVETLRSIDAMGMRVR